MPITGIRAISALSAPAFVGSAVGTAHAARMKFLLLDSRMIESTYNARLAVGVAKKHPANPLFGEDRPWEKRFDNLHANILYDQDDKLYKCRYSPFIADRSSQGMSIGKRNRPPCRPPRNREMGVCHALSREGLKWEKPALDLVDFDGTRRNNLILRGPNGAGVFKDSDDPDPRRRSKMVHAQDSPRCSAAGLQWSAPLPCAGIHSNGDTHNNLFWEPELQRHIGSVRLRDGKQRTTGRAESADLKQWSKAAEVLRGDAENQTYSMPVFRYAGVYLGLVAVFRTREDRVHTELAWSTDTLAWRRITDDVAREGSIKVFMVDDAGTTLASAAAITESVTDHVLQWDRKPALDVIRLRLQLRGAKVCSLSAAG